MIRVETNAGKELGTMTLGKDGKLACSTDAAEDLAQAKRTAYGWSDADIYRWFAAGGLDNGYVKATEVAA